MGYSVVNVNEMEPGGRTGVIKFVRRELGLEAFGLNWFELPQFLIRIGEYDEAGEMFRRRAEKGDLGARMLLGFVRVKP